MRCAAFTLPTTIHSAMAARPSLNDLPEEVLIAIFGYLSTEDLVVNIRKTCRRFSRLSRVPGLWRSLTIDDQQSSHHVAMLVGQRCVLPSPRDGRDITVAVKDVVTSVHEQGSVLPSCSVAGRMFYPKMESISLTRFELTSMYFLSKYPALRHLSVNVTCEPELVCNKYLAGGFRVLKNKLTQLKTLRFLCGAEGDEYSPKAATQQTMRDYFMSGPRLTQLTLGVIVKEDTVKAVVDHCTELQVLTLKKCDPNLTSSAFTAASKRSSLYSLRLVNCPGLNDKCLKSLALTFPNLRYLELQLTSKTTDEGLAFLFRACPGLRRLLLTAPRPKKFSTSDNAASAGNALTGRCLRQFARSISKGKLQWLRLLHFQSLDGNAFRALCQNQPNLRVVWLVQCGVSEDDVLFMVKHCQQMWDVRVEQCPQVGSRVMRPVMTLPRLTIAVCPAVGRIEDLLSSSARTRSGIVTRSDTRDSSLKSLKSLSSLTSLTINPCIDVTPRGLSAMLSLCPNLLHLVIDADDSVDDNCIRNILRTCGRLNKLCIYRIAGCGTWPDEPLTDDSLWHIRSKGAHLQTVHLPFSPRFSSDALAVTMARYASGVKLILRSKMCSCYRLNQYLRGFTPFYDQQVVRRQQQQQGKAAGQKKRRTWCRVIYQTPLVTFCVEEY